MVHEERKSGNRNQLTFLFEFSVFLLDAALLNAWISGFLPHVPTFAICGVATGLVVGFLGFFIPLKDPSKYYVDLYIGFASGLISSSITATLTGSTLLTCLALIFGIVGHAYGGLLHFYLTD